MSTANKKSTEKPTVAEKLAAVLDTLPLSTHGSSLSRNGLSRDSATLTPVGLLCDVKEELAGITGLTALLQAYAETDEGRTVETSMGAYRLGEYIRDQLDTVQALLSVLHGILPESFDA